MEDYNITPKLIIDASVAIKWISQTEIDAEKALLIRKRQMLKKINIHTPEIFFFEMLNYLSRNSPKYATQIFSELKMLEILECRLNYDTTLIAINLIQKYPKISFYDASYHALAITEKTLFITADEKYYETTKKAGHIKLLKNYK